MNLRYVYLLIMLFFVQIYAQNEITLNVKVFLSGCYSNSEMRTDLLNHDLIPKSQPFNDLVFNYNGSESVTNIPQNIVDWVLIEIRSDLTTKIAKKTAFLRNDGQIVNLDGVSNLSFSTIQPGDYYVIIYQRNHLAVMNPSKTLLNYNSPLYDFTDSQLKAYGSNSLKDLGDGKFGMIAGDGKQNGIINNLDYGSVANNIFKSTYIPGDLDMSGFVNVMDYSQVYSNILKKSSIPNEISNIIEVKTFEQLKIAIDTVQSGSVIQIQNDIEIDASYGVADAYGALITIGRDITIQGATYASRPRLWSVDRAGSDMILFSVRDTAHAIFRNLHLDGNKKFGFNDARARSGILVGGNWGGGGGKIFPNASAVIDSCEIEGFGLAGVGIINGATGEVKNSLIHKNWVAGLGYGVSICDGGRGIVHHCVFDSNRHHTASDGDPNVYYEVYENDFFQTAAQSGTYDADSTIGRGSHNVDVHAYGLVLDTPEIGSWDNSAADSILIYRNKFHATTYDDQETYDGLDRGIRIRGVPRSGAWIYDNEFEYGGIWGFPWQQANAIEQSNQLTILGIHIQYGNMFIGDNTFIPSRALGLGADYQMFQVKFGTNDWINWSTLGVSVNFSEAYSIDSLLFGDFNGDGTTDFITNFFTDLDSTNMSHYTTAETYKIPSDTSTFVYWNGTLTGNIAYATAPYVREFDSTNVNMSELTAIDVNGDGKTDLVRTVGGVSTYILCDGIGKYATTGNWATLPNPITSYTEYTERDFNGDGIDEAVRIITLYK